MTRHREQRRGLALMSVGAALALMTMAAGRAEAQILTPGVYSESYYGYAPTPYGYGVFGAGAPYALYGPGAGGGYGGYGGYGGGAGFGYPFNSGGYGISPFNYAFAEQERAAMNASRYNLMNAETATAYQAANLFRSEALAETADTYRAAKAARGYNPSRGRYNVATGGPSGADQQPIPMNQIIAKDGEVLWPLGAPEEGDLADKKGAASRAIREVAVPAMQGKAVPASQVVAARNALAAYANPAARWFEQNHKADYPGFVNYVNSLDRGLRSLAESGRPNAPAPAARTGGIDIQPRNATPTGGDVLLKQLRDRDKAQNKDGDKNSGRDQTKG